jgi:flagellar hook-length control protein FliK
MNDLVSGLLGSPLTREGGVRAMPDPAAVLGGDAKAFAELVDGTVGGAENVVGEPALREGFVDTAAPVLHEQPVVGTISALPQAVEFMAEKVVEPEVVISDAKSAVTALSDDKGKDPTDFEAEDGTPQPNDQIGEVLPSSVTALAAVLPPDVPPSVQPAPSRPASGTTASESPKVLPADRRVQPERPRGVAEAKHLTTRPDPRDNPEPQAARSTPQPEAKPVLAEAKPQPAPDGKATRPVEVRPDPRPASQGPRRPAPEPMVQPEMTAQASSASHVPTPAQPPPQQGLVTPVEPEAALPLAPTTTSAPEQALPHDPAQPTKGDAQSVPVSDRAAVTGAASAAPPVTLPTIPAEARLAVVALPQPNPLALTSAPALVAVPAPQPTRVQGPAPKVQPVAPESTTIEQPAEARNPLADLSAPTDRPAPPDPAFQQQPVADTSSRAALQPASEARPLPERVQPADVIRQIDAAITRSDNGTVEVSLNPKELGQVTIRIEVQQTDARMVFSADRPETLQLLRTHQADLQSALQNSGFTQMNLSFTDQSPGQSRQPAIQPGEQFTEPADSLPEPPRWSPLQKPAALGRYDRRI